MEHVVRSSSSKSRAVPRVSLPQYLLDKLRDNVPALADRDYVTDVYSRTNVKFRDLEDHSARVASALARRGFGRGDVLFFLSYEMAQLFVVQLAVWRLGGATRGCFQGLQPEVYARQIEDSGTKFLLVDAETQVVMREARQLVPWSTQLLSVGLEAVPDTLWYGDMLLDDGTALPDVVSVDVMEDVVFIANTSGSTGVFKGCMHTHHSVVAFLCAAQDILHAKSVMHTVLTNGMASFCYGVHGMATGTTFIYSGKFDQQNYFDIMLTHKPEELLTYPFQTTWFANCADQLARVRQAGFLRSINVGGWMLDPATYALLVQRLPQTSIRQNYGSSELILVALSPEPKSGEVKHLKLFKDQSGQQLFSNGNVIPSVEAKAVDPGTGAALPRGQVGEIHFRSLSLMKGYLVPGQRNQVSREPIDSEGWYHTGDLGFFDEEGELYIRERLVFTYKYCMQRISPYEIESVIAEHPAVFAAGVVGLPNPETDCETRAFVSLRPGCQATELEIVDFVAARMPKHKHIHAGVAFLPTLPVNAMAKLDRVALRKLALEERATNSLNV